MVPVPHARTRHQSLHFSARTVVGDKVEAATFHFDLPQYICCMKSEHIPTCVAAQSESAHGRVSSL